jgi:beta-RFAP synthase
MSVRVVAPCRLHFGLFHVPVDGLTHYPDGRPVRKFGGLGMMIDSPCVTVTSDPHFGRDEFAGTLRERASGFMEQVRRVKSPSLGHRLVATGPAEHTGLGVGTALGLSVATVAWSTGVAIEVRARMVDRGRRSGIGIHGFQSGGFVTDEGKITREQTQLSSRLAFRTDFPPVWRILLVRPPTPPSWFGDRERSAFARTRPADRALALTARLRSLAYDTVVPAVRNTDFDTFAGSIQEFNRLAGEPFHDDQGGPYAGAEVACVIDELIEMGAVGVGQSSWGPTVFAMCRDVDEANRLAERARVRFSSATEVTVTAANNTGARVTTG